MSSKFIPCPACARHVKQGDSKCPFCGVEVPRENGPPSRAAVGQLSRSALLAVSAMGAAVASTECSSSPIVPYGVPPYLAGAPSGDDSGGGADSDSSTPDDATREAASLEGGSAQPLYGAALPPPEAGHD